MKKQKQWGEEYTILGRSMRGFLDIQIFVPVQTISHFELSRTVSGRSSGELSGGAAASYLVGGWVVGT